MSIYEPWLKITTSFRTGYRIACSLSLHVMAFPKETKVVNRWSNWYFVLGPMKRWRDPWASVHWSEATKRPRNIWMWSLTTYLFLVSQAGLIFRSNTLNKRTRNKVLVWGVTFGSKQQNASDGSGFRWNRTNPLRMDDSLASSCTGLDSITMGCTVQTLGNEFEGGKYSVLCLFLPTKVRRNIRNEIHECCGKEIQIWCGDFTMY